MQLPEIGNTVLMRILLVVGAMIVTLLLARLVSGMISRAIQDPTKAYKASRSVRRIGGVLSVVLALVLLSPDTSGFVTILTVIGAGLAIAMRETLLSIAGWLRIVTISEYRIGDRVQIGEVHGDVIDIRLLRTTLMETRGWVDADQSTGRIVHVPNGWVWLHAVFNYSRGFSFIWNEIAYNVTFDSDWEAARDILLGLAEESAAIVEQQAAAEIKSMSREFLIHYGILTPFVYVRVVPDGVRLTLRYLCHVRKRRGTEHAITISALDAFKAHGGIAFAHAGVDVYRPYQADLTDPSALAGWPSNT